jgi:hypothetical protein
MNVPFWLKWVALPAAGLLVAFWVISVVVGAIVGAAFDLLIIAAAAGALYWGYHRVMMQIPAYRRKKEIEKARKDLY